VCRRRELNGAGMIAVTGQAAFGIAVSHAGVHGLRRWKIEMETELKRHAAHRVYQWCKPPTCGMATTSPSDGGSMQAWCRPVALQGEVRLGIVVVLDIFGQDAVGRLLRLTEQSDSTLETAWDQISQLLDA
jgi:hypothetical protein